MSWKLMALFFSLVLLGCIPSNHPSSGEIFCEIDQTETYTLGTDPTVDFNVTNLEKSTVFNRVTCPHVDTDSFSVWISRVKRSGSELTIIENQYTSTEFRLEMEISGNTLVPTDNDLTLNYCTIKRQWSGTLNTPPNALTVNEYITFRGNCAHVFINPGDRP